MINFKKHKYNINKYPFKELIEELYGIKELSKIHLLKEDLLPEKLNFSNEANTKFHRLFYDKLNNNWHNFIDIYKNFIKNEISKLVKKPFLYQSLPTYRVQLPNSQSVHKWHYDSDADHKHPDGEINFCIAITEMKETTAIWSESEPGKKDFSPMEIDYGEYYHFNGNKCTHGNKKNVSNKSRISFDFRIMPYEKYNPNYNILSVANKKKFEIGDYYQLFK